MSRRDRIEEETARRVEQRLHWLLTENGPEPVAAAARSAGSPEPTQRAAPTLPARSGAPSGRRQWRIPEPGLLTAVTEADDLARRRSGHLVRRRTVRLAR